MKLVNIKGQVVAVDDQQREFNEKDANGNNTGKKIPHRVTQISLIAQDLDKLPCVVLVRGWDLPATFACPKVGGEFVVTSFKRCQVNPTSVEFNI